MAESRLQPSALQSRGSAVSVLLDDRKRKRQVLTMNEAHAHLERLESKDRRLDDR